MGWNILGGYFILQGVALLYAGTQTDSLAVCIIMGLIFCILGIWVIYRHSTKGRDKVARSHDKKLKEKKNRNQDKAALLERSRNSISGLSHMDGLPLAQGAACLAFCKDEVVEISGGGTQFQLDLGKITDATVKTNVEIQRAYVSSIGGAVAGAALFGALGAMVGGRAKQKETRTLEHYLIITYLKEGQISYLSFLAQNVVKANDFAAQIQMKKGGAIPIVEL